MVNNEPAGGFLTSLCGCGSGLDGREETDSLWHYRDADSSTPIHMIARKMVGPAPCCESLRHLSLEEVILARKNGPCGRLA